MFKTLSADCHNVRTTGLHLFVTQEAAFQLLSMYRQETGSFMYWGSDPDPIQTFVR